ncbi:alpha-glucosidase [Periweissella fabalis]|uniref:Alpha-glucosidase n=1 Tax=Periweissella fabalis TaxID=1070421 RepID=A0A7X6N2V5_9LACO|nr:alpha-glucosidase [Periweissella fabalis]MCM0599840.1 alpha-glucosidase [Periweissella fabalis]NKZ24105.1 alpha-glucosidase [Periweissella fabalis]
MPKQLKWWQDQVAYQIYPRSFQDTNADGIGDLQGIISKLDYLKSLGVTMIWISPIYQSPMVDMGYDISDYQAIDPQFGTMADFDELLIKAKQRDIKIIMDLVVNHTSDQHAWFKAALADPKSKYRDYYIFKQTNNGKVPNNWRGIFGGSTWTEVPGEPGNYYFHTFAPQQPELNWENPELRQEIYQMINWWLDKGIGGFRIDAITHLKKDLDWASIEPDANDGMASVVKKGQNRPGINLFLDELKRETFDKYDCVTIGEAYGVPEADLKRYIGPDGYFSMIFDFSYMNIDVKNVDEWFRGRANWTVPDLKEILFNSQRAIHTIGGHAANVLENHDQPRVLSKLVPNKADQTPTAAKALATMYYYLPGVPFIYQGQEIGMKNAHRNSIEEFNDVSTINNYHAGLAAGMSMSETLASVNAKSRDNARTPMQWDDSVFGGFSTVTPWLPMGDDRDDINVVAEDVDQTSVLNFYRQLGQLRQTDIHNILIEGTLKPINLGANVVAYQRILAAKQVTLIVNLDNQNVSVEYQFDEVLLNNLPTLDNTANKITLAAYQAIVVR